jgi:hypothetical protein
MRYQEPFNSQLCQIALKSQGLYDGRVDGIWGPMTQAGFEKYVAANRPPSSLIAQTLVGIAKSEVGVREIGHNSGDRIREYQSATWLPPGPWPWCAAFVCWCIRETSRKIHFPFDLPKTAGAWDFENWAREAKVKLIKPANELIRAGDIVIFKFSHIGIAHLDEHDAQAETIDGNTDDDGGREGDGTYEKVRWKSNVRSIIRLEAA